MIYTITYLIRRSVFALFSLKEIGSSLSLLSKNQGDGGVDVTGAPNSKSVEGADFGQTLGFKPISVIIGGSNFGAAGKFWISSEYPASF